LAVFCPITSKEKGYPFEVAIDTAKAIRSTVLADQIKSLDWRKRKFVFITTATKDQIQCGTQRNYRNL
jgi:mRNA interferase MazF